MTTRILRLQHVSVPMPPGEQDAARGFYLGVLGMEELPTPHTLVHLGVVWFKASEDGHEVHLYEEPTMANRAPGQHLCLQVDDIAACAEEIAARGVDVVETIVIPGRPRRFVHDPFGNQIELLQIEAGAHEVGTEATEPAGVAG